MNAIAPGHDLRDIRLLPCCGYPTESLTASKNFSQPTSQRAWMTRSARLSLGVACRLTMTRRPPALHVRSGRLQAGVIWRLLPKQSATPAALACSLAASNSLSGNASSLRQDRFQLVRIQHQGEDPEGNLGLIWGWHWAFMSKGPGQAGPLGLPATGRAAPTPPSAATCVPLRKCKVASLQMVV